MCAFFVSSVLERFFYKKASFKLYKESLKQNKRHLNDPFLYKLL